MSLATFDDVKVRFHRDLDDELRPLVEQRLEDAEDKIRVKLPLLDDLILVNPALARVVVRITSDAVLRLITNPDGYVQETDGNYTYMLSQAVADSRLKILPDEWADLGVRKSVGIVHFIPRQAGFVEPA